MSLLVSTEFDHREGQMTNCGCKVRRTVRLFWYTSCLPTCPVRVGTQTNSHLTCGQTAFEKGKYPYKFKSNVLSLCRPYHGSIMGHNECLYRLAKHAKCDVCMSLWIALYRSCPLAKKKKKNRFLNTVNSANLVLFPVTYIVAHISISSRKR